MKRIFTILAVACAAAVGLAAPAAAERTEEPAGPPKAPLSHSAEVTGDCGEVTLTFTNTHEGHTYAWNVQTSDGQNFNVTVPSGKPVTKTVTLEPGEGSGFVSYGTVFGPERDYFLTNGTIGVPLCAPPPPHVEPAASIGEGHCPANGGQGGVKVTLDNSKSETAVVFTVVSDFGDDSRERTREVAAGGTDELVAYAPEDVEGAIRVLVDGEVVAEQSGMLNCLPDEQPESPKPEQPEQPDGKDDGKDESPAPKDEQPDDTAPVTEVENASSDKGGNLPFTGSPLRAIVALAVGLIAAGGAIFGGLRLSRHRG